MGEVMTRDSFETEVPPRIPKEGFLSVVNDEVVIEPIEENAIDPERNNNNFVSAAALVEERADEFYGQRIYGATISSRLRIFHKALNRVKTVEDYQTRQWRNNFKAAEAIKQGNLAQQSKLKTVSGEPLRAGEAFHRPEIKAAVQSKLLEENDPTMHIIRMFEQWADRQSKPMRDNEINQSRQAFELILFSVHGPRLVSSIQELLDLQQQASTETP